MPLPKALAAKLAKRGLLKLNSSKDTGRSTTDQDVSAPAHEEIIAEDYDETPQNNSAPTISTTFDKFQGWYACPNKWNVYHECTTNCQELWKIVKEIDKEYGRKRLKMLLKYPILEHWREILDIGIGRYYYWNTETNLVSWLPPGHPKCQVSLSAADLRKTMIQERDKRILEEKEISKSDDEHVSEDDSDSKRKVDEDSTNEPIDEVKEKRKISREVSHDRRTKKRKGDKDFLDPMDPAAYSDCPRGNWSSGLQEKNEARTGVDTTASGPLFQMRPYPSPGSVLRANAASSTPGPQKPS